MLNVKNNKVLEVLDSWQSIDWEINLTSCPRIGPRQPEWDINDYDKISKLSTSDQYIKDIIKGEDPRYYSVTNIFGEEPYGKYIFDRMPFDYDNAYTVMYNPKGFVGWHHEYRVIPDTHLIMMTYSVLGDGFYKDYDNNTGKIFTTYYKVGWNFRTNPIGTHDNLYWHCAFAPSPRFSWAFGFETEQKYVNAVNKLIEL